jgi:hypothetical protein
MKVKTPEMISFEVMSKAMNSRIFKATIDDVENVRKGLLRLERFDREKLNYKVSDEEIAKRKIVFDILEELLNSTSITLSATKDYSVLNLSIDPLFECKLAFTDIKLHEECKPEAVEYKIGDKIVLVSLDDTEFTGVIVSINDYREPSLKYAIQIKDFSDLIFIGETQIRRLVERKDLEAEKIVEKIKQLREKFGYGMYECREVMSYVNNDYDKAVAFIVRYSQHMNKHHAVISIQQFIEEVEEE